MKRFWILLAVVGLLAGLAQGCEASKHEDHDATSTATDTAGSDTATAADTGGNSMGGMDM